MKNTSTSKNGLFLMEMILVVLLFSLSAAVCLQMFGYANLTAQRAEDLSNATLSARSTAACFQSTNGDLDEMAELLSGHVDDDTLLVYYGSDWSATPSPNAYYLQLTTSGTVAEITLYQTDKPTPIYTLSARIAGGDGL